MLNRLKAILADFFQQADLVLLGLCCTASIYGLVLIFSATNFMSEDRYRYIIVQGAAMLIGIVAYIAMSMVDLEILMKRWKWILAFNILMFLLLIPFGVSVSGNRAWLKFPGMPVNIGPAEIVKISFTLLLAKQLSWLREEKQDLKSFRAAAFVGGHTLFLMGLYVVISGDMGNALTFFFIFLCMAFAAGFALRWFALLFAGLGGGIAFVLLLDIVPASMDYMLNRFRVLFDHSYDSLGVGWQQTRSLLALGGGKLTGQGLFHGTQTQAKDAWSLPARHTDFIFSVIGEELGMLGCLFTIALLAAIIFRCVLIARHTQQKMDMYICVLVAAMLIFQVICNIGMCLFVMPVIGLTLPFVSYGGTSIVTLFAAMGMASGIQKRARPEWLR